MDYQKKYYFVRKHLCQIKDCNWEFLINLEEKYIKFDKNGISESWHYAQQKKIDFKKRKTFKFLISIEENMVSLIV